MLLGWCLWPGRGGTTSGIWKWKITLLIKNVMNLCLSFDTLNYYMVYKANKMFSERRTIRGSLALKQDKTRCALEYAVGRSYCCGRLVTKSCLFATPWTAVCQASLSFTISLSLLKLTSIELVSSMKILYCKIYIIAWIKAFTSQRSLRLS